MTQLSYPWSCTATGDGGPASYSLDIVEDTNKFFSNLNPDEAGVVYWTQSPNAGLLAPTNPSAGVVRIASGVGVVEGWVYTNDANVDFDINADAGNASATDIIVLQRDLSAQTVRLARIKGAASTKATVTQTAAIWEVVIAEVVLTAGGLFSSLVDVRKLAVTPVGTMIKIDEVEVTVAVGAITFSSIPQLFSTLKVFGTARDDGAGTPSAVLPIVINAAAANHDSVSTEADSTPATTIASATGGAAWVFLKVPTSGSTANSFGSFELTFPQYSETVVFKTILAQYNYLDTAGLLVVGTAAGWHTLIAAITDISFDPILNNFDVGSKISLYGIV